jgi:hypothetical protein
MDGVEYVKELAAKPSLNQKKVVSNMDGNVIVDDVEPPSDLSVMKFDSSDVLILDVDSKNLSEGISCPAPSFITSQTIKNCV